MPATREARELGAVAFALGLLVGLLFANAPQVGSDTAPQMRGTDVALDCLLHGGPYRACGMAHGIASGARSDIGPYPLLQYVIDAGSKAMGFGRFDRLEVLSLVSLVSFLAVLAYAWIALRRRGLPHLAPLVMLVLITGPYIAYANATWGEMLAAALLTGATAAALCWARPALLALAVLGAALTKETSYPFILALTVVGLLLARPSTASMRSRFLGALAGIAGAVVVAAAFNEFRYGALSNLEYSQAHLRTPGLAQKLDFFAALLVAPNGGIVIFWLSATLVVALACLALFLGEDRTGRRYGLALAVIVIALNAGLALWWVPFGWWAWGPRLTLPWVPPVVLLAVVSARAPIERALRSIASSRIALVATGVALTAVTAPQLGFSLDASVTNTFFNRQDPWCNPSISNYVCVDHQAWSRSPIWLHSLNALRGARGIVALLLVAGLIAALLSLQQRLIRTRPPE